MALFKLLKINLTSYRKGAKIMTYGEVACQVFAMGTFQGYLEQQIWREISVAGATIWFAPK